MELEIFMRKLPMKLQIKYCGNKSLADLQITSKSNADYIGIIFAESKRQVKPIELKQWLTKVDIGTKQLVGVFVNSDVTEIIETLRYVPLSIIQCHGTETSENLMEIKAATNLPVWKVIHHQEQALNEMKGLSGIADGFVIDSKVKGLWGGSGKTFDWSFIPAYVEEARLQGVPCFIAGGINLGNIEELLKHRISAIDISSGIELNDKKSVEIITKIEEQVGNYDSSSRHEW
jgi:phosphoribosylanthranilate isomerase